MDTVKTIKEVRQKVEKESACGRLDHRPGPYHGISARRSQKPDRKSRSGK